MYPKAMRKDGKVPVTLVFDNGVHLKKLWTPEQVQSEQRKIAEQQEQHAAWLAGKSAE